MPPVFHSVANSVAEDNVYRTLLDIEEEMNDPKLQKTFWDRLLAIILYILSFFVTILEAYDIKF